MMFCVAFPEDVLVPCSLLLECTRYGFMYVVGLTTQHVLLLFAKMLRLFLVVFATVQVPVPLKEVLLLTLILTL